MGVIAFNPCASEAKTDDEQNQIILLNDSAAALEESDPRLSKGLSQFADEKEKEWEAKQANKDALPAPVTDKELSVLRGRIQLLKEAAIAVKPSYPLIAKNLYKMAKDLNRTIENEE